MAIVTNFADAREIPVTRESKRRLVQMLLLSAISIDLGAPNYPTGGIFRKDRYARIIALLHFHMIRFNGIANGYLSGNDI